PPTSIVSWSWMSESALEVLIWMPYAPSSTSQRLSVLLKNARSEILRLNVTVFVWPAGASTFWKPSDRLSGRWRDGSASGVLAYSSTTSLPSVELVFATSALTWIVSSAVGLWLSIRRFENAKFE